MWCEVIENVHTAQKDEPRAHCSVMTSRKMIAKEKKYFLMETDTQLLRLSAVGKHPVIHTSIEYFSMHACVSAFLWSSQGKANTAFAALHKSVNKLF